MGEDERGWIWWTNAWTRILLIYVRETLIRLVLYIGVKLPIVGPKIKRSIHKISNMALTNISEDEWIDSMFSYSSLIQCIKCTRLDVLKKVSLGSRAYNASVSTLDGKLCKILDFQREGRPLVLNFGSCT